MPRPPHDPTTPRRLPRRSLLLGLPALAALPATSASAHARFGRAETRRALLIGITGYKNGIPELNTVPDVRFLTRVLREKWNFTDIRTCDTPETTTAQGIQNALQKLLADTRRGDAVFLHFSGSGHMIVPRDPTEPEFRFLTSDSRLAQGGDLEGGLSGQQLGRIFQKMLEVTGTGRSTYASGPGCVLVSMDCCAAGALFYNLAQPVNSKTLGPLDRSGLVVLAAAAANQMAMEEQIPDGTKMGLFSYLLGTALSEAAGSSAPFTYREISELISTRMEERGTGTNIAFGNLDRDLFGSRLQPVDPYTRLVVSAKTTERGTDLKPVPAKLSVPEGALQRLTIGSVYDFYAPRTRRYAGVRPLARAKVTSVSLFSSVLELLPEYASVKTDDLRGARARLRLRAADRRRWLVDISPLSGQTAQKVGEVLATVSQVFVVRGTNFPTGVDITGASGGVSGTGENLPLLRLRPVAPGDTSPRYVIQRPDDRGGFVDLATGEVTDSAAVWKERVEREARWRYFQQLTKAASLTVIVNTSGPATAPTGTPGKPAAASAAANKAVRNEGDRIEVSFQPGKNSTLQGMSYAYLIALLPDGRVTQIYPSAALSEGDNPFPWAGKYGYARSRGPAGPLTQTPAPIWEKIPLPVELGAPFGQTTFVVVATTAPVKFAETGGSGLAEGAAPFALNYDLSDTSCGIEALARSVGIGTMDEFVWGKVTIDVQPDATLWLWSLTGEKMEPQDGENPADTPDPATDTEVVAKSLQEQSKGQFQTMTHKATRGAALTAAGIRAAGEELARSVRSQDTLVVYACGALPPEILETSLPPALALVAARKRLLVFDTGGDTETYERLKAKYLLGDDALARATGRGTRLLYSAGRGSVVPLRGVKPGPVAYGLTLAVQGKADNEEDPKGIITAEDTTTFLGFEIQRKQKKVTLKADGEGVDFPLARYVPSANRGVAPGTVAVKPQEDVWGGKCYALLFATNIYAASQQWGPLKNPIDDAKALAETLKNLYGFETELVLDPTVGGDRDIETKMFEYIEKKGLRPEDQLLVFFAGHGDRKTHPQTGQVLKASVVAANSAPTADDPNRRTYLDYAVLRDRLDDMPCNNVLLLLDVCYGGNFDRSLSREDPNDPRSPYKDRSAEDPLYASKGLSERVALRLKQHARLFLASGGNTYVPDGRPGYHSPFASKLLGALQAGVSDIGYLDFYSLVPRVEKNAATRPHYGGFASHAAMGDFVFLPGGGRQS